MQTGQGVPARLGRCTLLEDLGDRPVGHLWRARQDSPAREVIAVVRDFRTHPGVEPGARARLRGLARVERAAVLDHPALTRVFGAGQDDERIWWLREPVDGVCFGSLLAVSGAGFAARAPLLGLVHDWSAGLLHAHQHGFHHHALWPTNLVVDARGRLRILDFAPAEGFDLASWPDCARFLSPEVRAGCQPDARSEIWSFACLVEEVAGSEAPAHWRGFVARGMQDDPARRPESLASYLHGMEDLLPGRRAAPRWKRWLVGG